MRRSVSIYQRKAKIIVAPMYKTTAGLYVEKPPVRILKDNDLVGVGEAVLAALEDYEEGLPMPDWRKVKIVPVVQNALNMPSMSTFHRGLKGCSLDMKDDIITIIPDRNKGPRDGLIPLSDKKLEAPVTDEPEIIGNLVKEGLSRAE